MWVGGFPKTNDYPFSYEFTQQRFNWGHQINRFALTRHFDAVNSVFLDGSARKVELPELWQLQWSETFEPSYNVDIPWL